MSATHKDAPQAKCSRNPSPARGVYSREQEAVAWKEVVPSGEVAAGKEAAMNPGEAHAVCGKSVVADAKPAVVAAGHCIGY